MKSPTLQAMIDEARPGTCIVCDTKTPPPKRRLKKRARTLCNDPACALEWFRIYSRDRRARQRATQARVIELRGLLSEVREELGACLGGPQDMNEEEADLLYRIDAALADGSGGHNDR